MTSPVDEGGRVVKHIIDSGAFDDVRKNVNEELRHSAALRDYVREQVENSKTLSGEGGKPSKDRKRVLDELQNELKDRLVERASRVVWEILTKSDGRVAQDIEHKVHQAVCRIYEEREKQQAAATSTQQQPEKAPQQPVQPTTAQGIQAGAALPPRPAGAPTASLAGRPPPRHYGVYGQPAG